jgi:hypothetical protein
MAIRGICIKGEAMTEKEMDDSKKASVRNLPNSTHLNIFFTQTRKRKNEKTKK